MALPEQGQLSSLGVVDEVDYGTPVTVSRFFEMTGEGLSTEIEHIPSEGLRAGRYNQARTLAYARHNKGASGEVNMELQDQGLAWWLKHLLGAVTTTGTAPEFTHTGSIASLEGKSFTTQIVKGTKPHTYHGCKVMEWEIGAAVGEIGHLNVTIDSEEEDLGVAAAVASYPSPLRPLSFLQGLLSIDATPVNVTEFTAHGNNNLANERYFIRQDGRKLEPTDQGREYDGSLSVEYSDDTEAYYQAFLNGTEAALVLKFEGITIPTGAVPYKVEVTIPKIIFTGETPTVDGPEIIPMNLPYMALDDDLTIDIVNSEPAP